MLAPTVHLNPRSLIGDEASLLYDHAEFMSEQTEHRLLGGPLFGAIAGHRLDRRVVELDGRGAARRCAMQAGQYRGRHFLGQHPAAAATRRPFGIQLAEQTVDSDQRALGSASQVGRRQRACRHVSHPTAQGARGSLSFMCHPDPEP